ncbi:MAG: NAD(P)/FAD-dependent oxidoreductase [Cyclobacteriaceae bacterium]
MTKVVEISLTPREAFDEEIFESTLRQKLGATSIDLAVRPVKRSIDARGRKVVVRVLAEVTDKDAQYPSAVFHYEDVSKSNPAIVVGAGPAGLFAALRLIELGIKPIVIERGKDVQSRRRDLAAINKEHIVNPDSNYCFGEGGAGTYSDGKLYTRSKKRGDVQRILDILVAHGARKDILFDAHPHIGTNKLPGVVQKLREQILASGGEIRFETRVTDFIVSDGKLIGVKTHNGETVKGIGVILATGHSARDIYELLLSTKIEIESKPFALGVRVEHSQNLIDQIQYHCETRDPFLPASSYALVHQAKVEGQEIGVFSFCMCPGGFIVPSATAPGEVVVNGMSPSRRDSRFANSGIVVEVNSERVKGFAQFGPLAGMRFQQAIEQKACEIAGGTQCAPAQRLIDFVDGKYSNSLLDTSYQPGLKSVELKEVLPAFITDSLKQGFRKFGEKMKGYLTNEAQVVGVESRTSAPVRIPRDKATFQHPIIKGLFPCGEGAGFAGGIVSAAMDGEKCAEALARFYFKKEIS